MFLKNISKKSLILLLTIFLLIAQSSVNVLAAQKASIKLNKSSVSIALGETVVLKATVTGKTKTVKWKSSNNNVASVSQKGEITPIRNGRVEITASANGLKAKCIVTVWDSKIFLRDFRLTSDYEKITMGTPYVNAYSYLLSNGNASAAWYHEMMATQYHISNKGIISTLRGITLGMTMQDVLNAYGSANLEPFSKTSDKFYLVSKQSYGYDYYNAAKTLDKAKYVLVYKYYKDANFAIRFYFDGNKKLIAVCYTRNYDSWSQYDNWNTDY